MEKLHLPAELQSPKIIIEEQIDKVVTKMDPFHHAADDGKVKETATGQEVLPKNDIYPMDDGASLLERCIPEAITSTTIAKETFVVRPANGDIYSKWMDVVHMSVHKKGEDQQQEEMESHGHGDSESIMLDIAGYKTEEDKSHRNEEAKSRSVDDKAEENGSHRNEETSSTSVDDKAKESSSTVESKASPVESPEDGGNKPIKAKTEEKEERKHVQMKPGETYRIEMSLCGLRALGRDDDQNNKVFNEHQITYDHFVHNPNLLNDDRLVFRYNGQFYASDHTGPLFASLLPFRLPSEDRSDSDAAAAEEPTKVSDSRDTYTFGRGWRQWLSRSSVAASNDQSGNSEKEDTDHSKETATLTTTTKTTSVGWSADHTHPDEQVPLVPSKNYAKTLRLTSDQLKSLNLKKGANTITFSVTSAYQGTATCSAKIFFWDYDVKIVISDIDGTITKSDALGHVFTMIGKDWTHNGVAKLYTDIKNNGYQLLYLTSRAIGQADYTRDYLKKVEQNKYQLPEGPVIMSPDRLFTSFHREVIMRKPEIFKMACLRDILRLFGGRNPFYAGFGNRITDAISYRSVDVPASRIFTIDPNGDVKLELLTGFKSSYIHLNDLVDQIFPPINKAISEEFNDYNFWKPKLPDIEIPELDAVSTPTSPKPKPIVPDPSNTLPATSVAAAPERRKRGILRSFTSLSGSSSSSSATTSSVPVKMAMSSSTPTLLSTTTKSKDDSEVSVDSGASSDDQLSPSSPKTPPSSSASIVNKVLGGVFSRTFKSSSTTNLTINTEHRTNDDTNDHLVWTPTTTGYEEADDETFDLTLDAITDEISLDDIPFI